MNNPSVPAGFAAPRVLCLGDMGADIVASPLGQLPGPGEVVLAGSIGFYPGGNALNTAVALQRLGERAGFVGVLGDDPFGDLLLAQLAKMGLDLRGVRRLAGGATPTSLMYRAEGEDRRFIHAMGVGDQFTGEGVLPDWIPRDGVLLAAGYLKLRSWNDAALVEVFREGRRRGSTIMLNVCIPRAEGVDIKRCLELLSHVDVFVLNEDEARLLTGEVGVGVQAARLREAGARVVVITRGERGAHADDGRRAIEMGVFPVTLVDPSGCGDCFTAGLIAGWLRRWELGRALEFATAVGALGATALGCTSGVPPFAEVEQFIQRQRAVDEAL